MSILSNEWEFLLEDEFEKDYYKELRQFLLYEYNTKTIYPDKFDIFNALHYTDFRDVKVVILGQDPYHGHNQAHGLSFSVMPNVPFPPSLQNIFKELTDDIGCEMPKSGYLKSWADQGVLMLNSVLTVRAGQPNSHKNRGWEILTDKIISLLGSRKEPIVFILWGNPAKEKKRLIKSQHYIIESVHPSPLSVYRGFFGSKPFSNTNACLEAIGKEPIKWAL